MGKSHLQVLAVHSMTSTIKPITLISWYPVNRTPQSIKPCVKGLLCGGEKSI